MKEKNKKRSEDQIGNPMSAFTASLGNNEYKFQILIQDLEANSRF